MICCLLPTSFGASMRDLAREVAQSEETIHSTMVAKQASTDNSTSKTPRMNAVSVLKTTLPTNIKTTKELHLNDADEATFKTPKELYAEKPIVVTADYSKFTGTLCQLYMALIMCGLSEEQFYDLVNLRGNYQLSEPPNRRLSHHRSLDVEASCYTEA